MNYEERQVMRGLILLLALAHPKSQAIDFHRYWYLHKVTRDYEQPSYGELQTLVKEARRPL